MFPAQKNRKEGVFHQKHSTGSTRTTAFSIGYSTRLLRAGFYLFVIIDKRAYSKQLRLLHRGSIFLAICATLASTEFMSLSDERPLGW